MGLLRLATYAIVGYAAYSIITDIMQSQKSGGLGQGGRQGGRQTRGAEAGQGGAPAPQITGPAGPQGGMIEETQGADGGSTPHRVGRGVIST